MPISCNTFNTNFTGSTTSIFCGFQGSKPIIDPNIGMTFFDNEHNDYAFTTRDYDILTGGRIAPIQGTPLVPTGIVFSQTYSTQTNSDFNKPGGDIVVYYYTLGTNEMPQSYIGLSPFGTIIENGDCIDKNKQREQLNISEIENEYNNWLYVYNSLNQQYYLLIDNGNSISIIEDISTATPANSNQVFSYLLNHSPFLSIETLKRFYERHDIFDNGQRYQLLSANPDAIRRAELRDFVRDHEYALTTMELNQIDELATSTITSRGELEAHIN